MLYFCDANWWHADGPRNGQFCGRQIVGRAQNGALSGFPSSNVRSTLNMIWDGSGVGAGGNSGFQAINLLALWGAKRLILTGFDHCDSPEIHWHGPHVSRPNPKPKHYRMWRDAMARSADDLRGRVEVLNASRKTALDCFERVELAEVI